MIALGVRFLVVGRIRTDRRKPGLKGRLTGPTVETFLPVKVLANKPKITLKFPPRPIVPLLLILTVNVRLRSLTIGNNLRVNDREWHPVVLRSLPVPCPRTPVSLVRRCNKWLLALDKAVRNVLILSTLAIALRFLLTDALMAALRRLINLLPPLILKLFPLRPPA